MPANFKDGMDYDLDLQDEGELQSIHVAQVKGRINISIFNLCNIDLK